MAEVTDAMVEAAAAKLFPWAFPPGSDKDDELRKSLGKKPRCGGDWEPTRKGCRWQARRLLEVLVEGDGG